MIKRTKKTIWKILNIMKIGGSIQLKLASALVDDGWFKSFWSKQSVDKNGRPIPWWTYSCIDFIEARLNKKMSVFEYGCGNSTIWLSKRVKDIKSVESDIEWFSNISQKLPANAKVVHKQLEDRESYVKEILANKKKYHIVIIDGRERIACAKYSLEALRKNGVIIFDNAERKIYKEGIDLLLNNNFKRIDFWGIGPITEIKTCTTIFYRNDNCLGI